MPIKAFPNKLQNKGVL